MILLHMGIDNRTWKKLDSEAELLEDKNWLYPLNILRRLIKKISNPLEKGGLSLIIKIYPKQKISVMALQEKMSEILRQSEFDVEKCILSDKEYGSFQFDVSIDYGWHEDKFVEVDEEAEEDLGEQLKLENEAKYVSIELAPKNEKHIFQKQEQLFFVVLKAFNKIMKNVSSTITYNAKFILEVRFEKNKEKKLKDVEGEVKGIFNEKVYIRYCKDYDKLCLSLPFEEINDAQKMQKLLSSIK